MYYGGAALMCWIFYGGRTISLSTSSADPDQPTLKILSYNIGHMKHVKKPDRREEYVANFLDFLKTKNVDVICFQEFSFFTHNLTPDLEQLGYQPVFVEHADNKRWKYREIFFIKAELADKNVIKEEKEHYFGVKASIWYHDLKVTLLNTHVRSYHVKNDHPLTQSTFREALGAVYHILGHIYHFAAYQVREIAFIIDFAKYNNYVIFCGDFNNVPTSYAYTLLRRNFTSAFEKAGFGFGFTYLGNTLRFLRIDHQFYRGPGLECVNFEEINFGLSDHKAIYGEYTMP